MTRLSILFLLTFSFIFYCEQREVFYSDLANKEASPPLVVFYERALTVISCGVKCFNDNCCVRFIYNTISKQCMGVQVVERDVYSYQQVPSLSSEMQQFRKGKKKQFLKAQFLFFYHIAIFFSSFLDIVNFSERDPIFCVSPLFFFFRIHITTL